MADIIIDDITNVNSTGIFDRLMAAVNDHIDTQYQNNRITGSDYANVYLGSIQSVLQAAVQYNLQEQLTEAQIDLAIADNLLKAKQLEIAEQERLAKAYEVTTLLVDQHNTSLKQQILLDTQEEGEQYKVTFILPKELESITKDIDVKERGMTEQETMGTAQRTSITKDNLIKDEQIFELQEKVDLLQTQDLSAIYEKDFLLPAQLAQITKQTDVAERGMLEQEATGTKQRVLLDTEEQAKQYEVDSLLPEQLTKIQEEIDLLQSQDLNALEQLKIAYTERVLKDKQAAKLGLDNAMKLSEDARSTNTYIYTPRYEEV